MIFGYDDCRKNTHSNAWSLFTHVSEPVLQKEDKRIQLFLCYGDICKATNILLCKMDVYHIIYYSF